MNCLAYCLRFWEKNKDWTIFYNHNHAIIVKATKVIAAGDLTYTPLLEWGYTDIYMFFKDLLDDYERQLLKEYFSVNNLTEILLKQS